MIRIEPNLLLAIATGMPLLLLTLTATVFGEPGPEWRYPFLAGLYTIMFVALNKPLSRLMKMRTDRPPMISAEVPMSVLWASSFPGIVMLMAAVPFLIRGFDYGLLVVIASIMFGFTVDSAMKALKRP
ncbi:hypothetical protein [Brevundimonas variabilis]|uniref:Uncharacterized protein n=1 Tax=Brevundimonas variabilis TaxID=74312 RepID=A0A7W9CHT6_9CAUL|nr:hypothetical protein [Brevundimonas variabilis]MBB5745882.1 hypothetical protein [Brevundimonas variabilis]